MSDTTVTKYAAARGNDTVGGLYDTLEGAQQATAAISDTMLSIGLTPDVTVATVDVTTTTSDPTPYVAPEPAPVEDEQAPEQGDDTDVTDASAPATK